MEASLLAAQEAASKADTERQAANEIVKSLTEQNGHLLLLLSQAQNEVKLLASPKETLLQRLKKCFSKK